MRNEFCTDIGPTCQSTGISAHADDTTSPPSILSAAASLVSPIVSPDDAADHTMSAISGPNTVASFASFGPDGSWQKTCQGYSQRMLDGSLEPYSQTWPRSGTMQNGQCYQRAPWVPHTHGSACSWWPTPAASDHSGGGSAKVGRGETRHQIAVTDTFKARFGHAIPIRFVEWLMGFPEGWTKASD